MACCERPAESFLFILGENIFPVVDFVSTRILVGTRSCCPGRSWGDGMGALLYGASGVWHRFLVRVAKS